MTNLTNAMDPRSEQDLLRDPDARAKVTATLACLQAARDQVSGLECIREVVANVLGSEEVAVFKVDKEKAVLWLYWYAGIDPNKYVCLDVMREPRLQSVLAGDIVTAEYGGEKLLSIEDPVNALVPVFLSDTVAAVIVIFRLLPQKTALDASDRHVCRTLSVCASQAVLPTTNLHRSIQMKRDSNK